MKIRKITAVTAAVFMALCILCSCSSDKTDTTEGTPVIMGSMVSIDVYGTDKKENAELKENAIEEIRRVDLIISKNNEQSELYKINQNSGKVNDISAELLGFIQETSEIYSLSDGRLSATSGALTELWGIDTEDFRLPEKDEIEKAILLCDDSEISVTEGDISDTVSVRTGQLFNLGSVGKGIACDKAVEIISKGKGCEGAVISVGGSVAVLGKHNGDSVWKVGIRDPYGKSSDIFAVMSVENCYISTSGNYEKKFTIDGKTYHHILDLKTGYPVENDLCAVTVVAKTGLESDALSTMCYVLGEEKSLELLKMYDAEAVFIYSDKTVSTTDGLKGKIKISNPDYILK